MTVWKKIKIRSQAEQSSMNIGIFGGAFNPVHNGHLHLLNELYNATSVEKLLVIPTANPPHKSNSDLISGEHRINMLKLALNEIGNNGNVEISTIEFESEEKSYTHSTLKKLQKIYPNDSFLLFVGSDQLFNFQKWYKCYEILQMAKLVAITREEAEHQKAVDFLNESGLPNVEFLPLEPVVVSSTEIRNRVKNGESIEGLVPKAVAEYIKDNNLYV